MLNTKLWSSYNITLCTFLDSSIFVLGMAANSYRLLTLAAVHRKPAGYRLPAYVWTAAVR